MSVYTTVDHTELADFLSAYQQGELLSFKGISAGITNTNYFVTTQQDGQVKDFVLTIFEEDSAEELPYFLSLMAFLNEQGIPVPHPIANRQQVYLQVLKGKPAVLVEKLTGHTIESPSIEHCRSIGVGLARLHLASQAFPERRVNQLGEAWRRQIFEKLVPLMQRDDYILLQQQLDELEQRDYSKLPKGITHCDLFSDNAMFINNGSGDKLTGIIDLYYACDDFWLYDLAIVANDWCSDGNGYLQPDLVSALLQAYHQERPLLDAETQQWNAMLRIAAIRFWLSRLRDKLFPKQGELTFIKDPDYFKQLLLNHIEHNSCSLTQLLL